LIAVVAPLVGPQQQVFLMLNQLGGSAPRAFALPSLPHATETGTLIFNTTNFQGGPITVGSYLARIRVDDAESRLEVDGSSGKFIGPIVTIA
jgi:hypothetical protein